MSAGRRVLRAAGVIGANVLLFLLLFGVVELAYRMHVDGAGVTVRSLVGRTARQLPEGHWVVRDDALGYRLNPAGKAVNSLSTLGAEPATPKPDGLCRLLYLGDSVTFDVPGLVSITRDSLSRLGPVEVLNASVPGYTSYQEVLFYERYLRRLEPDLVIWSYVLNDNHRMLHRFAADGRMLLTREAAASLNLPAPWSAIVGRSYVLSRIHVGVVSLLERTGRDRRTRYGWEERADVSIAWQDASWREYERNLRRLLELTSRTGARLVVVVFPLRSQLEHAGRATAPDELAYVLRPQARIAALLERHEVPHLDLFPRFLAARERGASLYRDRIHLTPQGHAIAARGILAFLRKARLTPDHRLSGEALAPIRSRICPSEARANRSLEARAQGDVDPGSNPRPRR